MPLQVPATAGRPAEPCSLRHSSRRHRRLRHRSQCGSTAAADESAPIRGLKPRSWPLTLRWARCTQVTFVRDTHYVFTAGKDGALKYWDADRWELLLALGGHGGEAWALTVSSLGDFCIVGGSDKSLRRCVWDGHHRLPAPCHCICWARCR